MHRAALGGWMSWLLLHQTGQFDQAHRLAVEEVDRVDGVLGERDPRGVAVRGSLLIGAAWPLPGTSSPSTRTS